MYECDPVYYIVILHDDFIIHLRNLQLTMATQTVIMNTMEYFKSMMSTLFLDKRIHTKNPFSFFSLKISFASRNKTNFTRSFTDLQ